MSKPYTLTNEQLEVQYLKSVLEAAKSQQTALRGYLHDDVICLSQYEYMSSRIAVDISELEEKITILR